MRQFYVLIALWCVAFGQSCFAAFPAVQSIGIDPPVPNPNDDIVAHINGIMPSGGVDITGAVLTRNANHLKLDIDFLLGPLTVITPWSFDAHIGQLPPGSYDLTVVPMSPPIEFEVGKASFTVVPEPGALCAVPIAWLLGRRQRRQRQSCNQLLPTAVISISTAAGRKEARLLTKSIRLSPTQPKVSTGSVRS
jgi:hypothetical protein